MQDFEMKFNEKGLIPVITQDFATNEVLMLAYMNDEALKQTLETGYMVYFSRSRNKLWKKGETSGNVQKLKILKYDCDKDTLLAQVEQTGVACHTGNKTCFNDEIFSTGEKSKSGVISELFNVISDRKVNPKDGSYTTYLFEKGLDKILKKVGEESAETIIAAKNKDKKEVAYEAADLIYHLLVLLCEMEMTPDDISKELNSRRQ